MPDFIPREIELPSSGSGSRTISSDGQVSEEIEHRWLVRGPTSRQQAMAWGENKFPRERDGGLRTRLDPRPVADAVNVWEIVAGYQNVSTPDADVDNETAFYAPLEPCAIDVDVGGVSDRVMQFYSDSEDPEAYVRKFSREEGEETPNFKGAIGVSRDSVNGVERNATVTTWSESWLIPSRAVFTRKPARQDQDNRPVARRSYYETVQACANTTNLREFRGYPRGDVLFLGGRFSLRKDATMTVVTLSFSHRRGREPEDDELPGVMRTSFKVGEIAITERKPGWWHLDVLYDTLATGTSIVQRPRFARMGPIMPETDWSELRIWTAAWPQLYLDAAKFTH